MNVLKMHSSSDAESKDMKKEAMKPLIAAAAGAFDVDATSDRDHDCSPDHRIKGLPVATGPLHPPSFTSSPRGELASSEVSIIASKRDQLGGIFHSKRVRVLMILSMFGVE